MGDVYLLKDEWILDCMTLGFAFSPSYYLSSFYLCKFLHWEDTKKKFVHFIFL